MLLSRHELPILVVNLVYISAFTAVALRRTNHEFVLYAGVIIAACVLIVGGQRRLRFDRTILWGLTFWGLAHMAGGNLAVGDGILYEVLLIPISEGLYILRYDQVVHTFGFGVTTLVCHHLLRPYLRHPVERWGTLAVLIVLMGSGVGAMNEIIEFFAVLTVPETGVGGYENTLLDLCFNLLGGILAVTWIMLRREALPRATQPVF
jgi:uncharacterized membrane protein YjdF